MATDVFDEQFKNRLMKFQRDHGLTLDGELGSQAWTKLAEVATSKPEPVPEETRAETIQETAKETVPESVVVTSASGAPFVVTAAEYPLLFKFATLCVDDAGATQFILEELDADLDEINATIEEVHA
jgi:putative peptidoglycan binding protein